jgi:hypothetical protein
MMFRVLRRRKGQDIGGLVLVAELLVQLMDGGIIGQQHDALRKAFEARQATALGMRLGD